MSMTLPRRPANSANARASDRSPTDRLCSGSSVAATRKLCWSCSQSGQRSWTSASGGGFGVKSSAPSRSGKLRWQFGQVTPAGPGSGTSELHTGHTKLTIAATVAFRSRADRHVTAPAAHRCVQLSEFRWSDDPDQPQPHDERDDCSKLGGDVQPEDV